MLTLGGVFQGGATTIPADNFASKYTTQLSDSIMDIDISMGFGLSDRSDVTISIPYTEGARPDIISTSTKYSFMDSGDEIATLNLGLTWQTDSSTPRQCKHYINHTCVDTFLSIAYERRLSVISYQLSAKSLLNNDRLDILAGIGASMRFQHAKFGIEVTREYIENNEIRWFGAPTIALNIGRATISSGVQVPLSTGYRVLRLIIEYRY